jgi:hypothetical protein
VSEPETKDALADLILEGDRLQMADRPFRREPAAWMVSNHSDRLGHPQLLTRIGRGESPHPTPRRPLSAVMVP